MADTPPAGSEANQGGTTPEQRSPIGRLLRFCLTNKLVVGMFLLVVVGWGIMVAPFDWQIGFLPRDPVPVDAIPDIGENQQIVFTEWMGRSPQDIDDQITYPLTVALQGVPGVKTIRSNSMFGFSFIYIIFKEDVEFYWSRSRILEKLNSLPAGTLPEGVQPALGPDATGLGQIFWYTLEGQDPQGNPAGGWDLEELRTIQDWYVRYAFQGADGVSEVASVGGFVREYQVDVDPDAMRAYHVTLGEVYQAVKAANIDVGAKSIELNRVEYFVRGIGFIKEISDIENSVVKVAENVPVLVKHIAKVSTGPALRRGALDKGGTEAVGGVVVARYGSNPLAVIKSVKEKIDEISQGLPSKVLIDYEQISKQEVEQFSQKNGFTAYNGSRLNKEGWLNYWQSKSPDWPNWATHTQVTIVPFYDRSGLIYETLGTLNSALYEEILISVIVVILMVMHLRSSILISGLLPISVLMCFIAMKSFGVDANIVALSGIAIAIGTMVDMGIIICENILRHLDKADPKESRLEVIHRAASEVGGAVLTAVLTTVVSFLPVFTMIGAEGKLFKPLAFTKTFAILASVIVALAVIPPAAHLLFRGRVRPRKIKSDRARRWTPWIITSLSVIIVGYVLTNHWEPLGIEQGMVRNLIFVGFLIGILLGFFKLFQMAFATILNWCLRNKLLFLILPCVVLISGGMVWSRLGKEFMPSLDEGSFLYMPTTSKHASIGEAMDMLSKQGMAFEQIPEIESAVGKIGRVESPLDPAPVSMIETVINYKSQYINDKAGRRVLFQYDKKKQEFDYEQGELIPDPKGRPYRQWRDEIQSPQDIWDEIEKAGKMPGATGAPKLQPIETRLIMLQTGMRAPMGVKVKGPSLEVIEKVGLDIERLLKLVPGVDAEAVSADRIVGKPYLEIVPDRGALARYGVPIRAFQDVVEIAIGGRKATQTVEGRQRFDVRIRYQRELRDQIETMQRILVPGAQGAQIPLNQLAEIRYVRGPQSIKSEDTALVGYVLFDKKPGFAEVDVVEACKKFLEEKEDSGELVLPAGVHYHFAGNYENQIRSQKTLIVVLPLALFIIFMILYFQFKSVLTTGLVFSGIFVAWAGGFILLWCYGQDWFLDFSMFGVNMRELFQVHPINLSVAVWVGFLALFGIASDNGVIVSTYLNQVFRDRKPDTIESIRAATLEAAKRRVRPCLMTTATTILALIPVLTSTGRGSDVMVPMAIPTFGGMLVVLISIFVVPVLYCGIAEMKIRWK